MILCRVLGNVTSTVKDPCYDGLTLLVCQPVSPDGERRTAEPILAVDRVQAGEGDLVLVMREGNGVRQLFGRGSMDHWPIRSIIVGVVDHVEHVSGQGTT